MQRATTLVKNLPHKILGEFETYRRAIHYSPPCDVFINHRGIDAKRTIAGLLYNHLSSNFGLNPFLDSKNMKPGDKLFDKIDPAIRECKLGIAVFSPLYCRSYFCLHELALLMESRKRVIPIFYDVKPSQLKVINNGTCSENQLKRFSWALEEAKFTVGLNFDPIKGDWSEFLQDASDAVLENLREVDEFNLKYRKYFY